MKYKFIDDTTRNARIFVDYTGEKPDVKFSYPNIKDCMEGDYFFEFLYLLFLPTQFLILTLIFFFHPLHLTAYAIYATVNLSILSFFILLIILNKKFFKTLYPHFAALKHKYFHGYYEIKLDIKNVKMEFNKKLNKKEIFVEIPIFKNIFFDYKCKGDFSEKLKTIEVKEYPFFDVKKIKNKEEKHATDYFWYCRMYFIDEPKDGYVKIKFA